jgi:hypothetical protein
LDFALSLPSSSLFHDQTGSIDPTRNMRPNPENDILFCGNPTDCLVRNFGTPDGRMSIYRAGGRNIQDAFYKDIAGDSPDDSKIA